MMYSKSQLLQYGRVIIDRASSKTTTPAHNKIWRAVKAELDSEAGKALLKKLRTKGDLYVAANGDNALNLSLKRFCSASWSPTGKILTLVDRKGKYLSTVINFADDMHKNIAEFFAQCREYAKVKLPIKKA